MVPGPFDVDGVVKRLRRAAGSDILVLRQQDDGLAARVMSVIVEVFRVPERGYNPGVVRTLAKPRVVDGLAVASVPDLLASKLDVLRYRQKLRDYIDLAAIDNLSRYNIEDGLLFHIGRYGNTPGGFELDRIISLLEDPGTFPEDGVFAQDRDRVLAYLKNKAPALRRYLDHEILSPAAAGSEPLDRPDTAGPTEAFRRALRSPDEAIIEPPPPDVGPSTPDL